MWRRWWRCIDRHDRNVFTHGHCTSTPVAEASRSAKANRSLPSARWTDAVGRLHQACPWLDGLVLQIAILLYSGVSALDAVGPWEVLSYLPDVEIRFVGREVGPIVAEGGALLMATTHALSETLSPDIVLVPGGSDTPRRMLDDDLLEWLRGVHRTTHWTTSVCTGSLILAAAGILKGVPATTHWARLGTLRIMGARPEPAQRVVRGGKVLTAAGVSAGIDLALWLAGEIAGRERAEAIQLVI